MRQRTAVFLGLSLLLLFFLYVVFNRVEVYRVHNLNTGLNYTTIQEAIDAPETLNGHTIFVDAGTYNEYVVLNKSLCLAGENPDSTILKKTGGVISVESDNVTIANLTVEGSLYLGTSISISDHNNITIKNNRITYNYGTCLNIFNSSNIVISGNNFSNGRNGLYISGCSNCNVTENNFQDCNLRLDNSPKSTLRNNKINATYSFGVFGSSLNDYLNDIDESNSVNGKPIYYWINRKNATAPTDTGYIGLVNCTNVNVTNLNLRHNIQGVLLAYTNGSQISGNTIKDHNYAVYLDHSSNNTISSNLINDVIQEYGIYLTNSLGNIIFNNSLSNVMTTGIVLSGSAANIIYGNDITAASIGIELQDSHNNKIFHNNFRGMYSFFIDARISDSDNNSWDDGYPSGGNYWINYNGTDFKKGVYQNETGSDGIGDSPYVLDADNSDRYPLMDPYIVPEFPSTIILPLFMIIALFAVIFRKILSVSKMSS